MATVQIADIQKQAPFIAKYAVERVLEKSLLFRSGLVSQDARLTAAAFAGGTVLNVPFWNRISGNSNVGSDNPASASTPGKITSGQDKAHILHRNNSWSGADLVTSIVGEDPMAVIGNQLADYWIVEMQRILVQSITGALFSTGIVDTAVADLAIEDGANAVAANLFSAGASIDALQVALGDRAGEVSVLAVHSKLQAAMAKNDLITFEKDSDGKVLFQRYMDKILLVDDSLPVVAGGTTGFKYTSYCFGPGAVAYAEGSPKKPMAVERDEDAGDGEGVETLFTRKHFLLHPRGIAWTGTPTGASPTDAELATTTNWTQVYDRKDIPITALITNG